MKVFISSLITGLEPLREAAREAVTTLRHEPIMAEDFGAQPSSPQVACLSGLRDAEVVVLILGDRYGASQVSGLSATHEEYREAKGRKPVFAFVQEGVQREPEEAAFVHEVQGWEGGLFRGGFRTPADLRQAVTRALHDHALANATGPIDEREMMQRAVALLPTERSNYHSGTATLNLALAGGPRQSLLRPVEIEKPTLADALMKEGLFGGHRLLEPALGVKPGIQGDALVIAQERGAQLSLNEQGSISISLPVKRTGQMAMELIYEVVLAQLGGALNYASWVLDHVDPTERITHVAIAANLTGADHMAWRTQRESDASPNRISVSMGGNEAIQVQTSQPRAAVRLNAAQIVEDLVVLLKRKWR